MKKILWIALLLISVKGFTQITLEHTYPVETSIVEISPNYWNYYNATGNTLYIYSLNHSLITSFQITIPIGHEFDGAYFLSKGLFTSDTSQYAFEGVFSDTAAGGYLFGICDIQTQNGTTLLEVDSCFGGDIANTSEGTKFLVEIGEKGYTQIYDLPGAYFTGIPRPHGDGSDVNNAYPNPTADVIHLPYTLNGNEQGELIVTNMSGQLLKQYTVTNAFSDILLNTNDLPKGCYLYYLITNGTNSAAKQFVVQ